MTYEGLEEFLHHYKTGRLKRHLKVEEGKESIELKDNIYDIKGNSKL